MRKKFQTIAQALGSLSVEPVRPAICQRLLKYIRGYELRGTHPQALNAPEIGVHKMYFLPADQLVLFDEFGVTKREVSGVLAECETIDTSHIVTSDPFNVFLIWIVHRVLRSNLTSAQKEELCVRLLTYLHYKFFTSRVNWLFPHGANEATMRATVEGLSGKFDIRKKETATWRLLMAKRSTDVLDQAGIHHTSLMKSTPDDAVLYVISDIQTRLRNKLKLVTDAYYQTRERQEKQLHYAMSDDIDGEQVLRAVEARYEQMVISISADAISADAFISFEEVQLVCKLVRGLNPSLMKRFLVQFSDRSLTQYHSKKADITKEHKDGSVTYIGYRALIQQIVTTTYGSILRSKKLSVSSKLEILEKTMHIYKASRVSDAGILDVKSSLSLIIDETGLTSRDETRGALRIAFVLYVMLRSFDSM